MDTATLSIKLSNHYTSADEWQKRRHDDWRENYELYRDKVTVNRLTQRQTVNIPLMKETIKTILSKTDDPMDVVFESKGNDKQKELYLNEYWGFWFEKDKMVLKSLVDRKMEGLYGISTRKLNVSWGKFFSEVLDPHDIIFDRYVDPTDIDGTAQIVIHRHIYRTIKQVESNTNYDAEAVSKLKTYVATKEGIVKLAENADSMRARNERMQDLGVPDIENPAVGEVYVELNENFLRVWNAVINDYEFHLIVKADGDNILLNKPLEEILGVTPDHYWRDHLPTVTWSDDLERTDVYPDGVGDIVRTPNKIINAWFSQLVENRTLRNWGMNYYDSTKKEGFVPQTFEPAPWGWYPVPGNPNDIVKRVDIPDLSESFDEIAFIINMVERATAATATEKGQETKGKVTLGEIELIAAKALERISAMAKFYRPADREFAYKWYKLMEAAGDSVPATKLFKKSFKGNYFEKEISPADWLDEAGYSCKITSSAEQEEEAMKSLQKFQAVASQFPTNQALKRIYQKKALDLLKLSPEEEREVLEAEKQAMRMAEVAPPVGAPAGVPVRQPVNV